MDDVIDQLTQMNKALKEITLLLRVIAHEPAVALKAQINQQDESMRNAAGEAMRQLEEIHGPCPHSIRDDIIRNSYWRMQQWQYLRVYVTSVAEDSAGFWVSASPVVENENEMAQRMRDDMTRYAPRRSKRSKGYQDWLKWKKRRIKRKKK